MGWRDLLILLAVSAILCGVGFYRYVYFLSIGYGFAVGGIGVTLCIRSILGIYSASLQHYILFALLLLYGMRLSGFLFIREIKNAAYRKTMKEAFGDTKKMPIFVKFVIWICVSILYVAQTCPVFYRLYNGGDSSLCGWIAIGICIIAIVLETLSDQQKSAQKRANPNMVATKGLYQLIRCPNYLGEILFWTGIFVSGWDILQGVGQWLMAVLAYICIVYVMFNGAQRLEKRQMKRYGDNPEYQAYVNHTPILLPWVPLYHLNKQSNMNGERKDE
jgi:steroid 5-alpha reductase family enzyme